MNNLKAIYKHSRLDAESNFSIILILIMQTSLSLIVAFFGQAWLVNYTTENPAIGPQKAWYLAKFDEKTESAFTLYIQYAGTWFLMFTNFVPISLLVQLEVVKFLQAFIFAWDI
jgi:hypothetical protein